MDYDITPGLEILRDLGVLHVEPVNGLDSKDTEHVKGQIDTLERALTILASRKMHESVKLTSSAVSKANQIISFQEKKDQAEARLQLITKEMKRIKPLGPFSPSDLEDLKHNGLHVKIYRCHRKKLDLETLPVQHEVVGSRGSAIYLLAVSDEAFSLPYEEMTIPSKSLDAFGATVQ